MSDIDFQNGFICGMATKGLVRSGELYKPLCWNDEGVYDYFYIDFRRKMEAFSLGMFNESIVVHDSAQLNVTNIQQAYTKNPYVPVSTSIDLSNGTFTNTLYSSGVKLQLISGGSSKISVTSVSASSQYSADFSPDKAIDGNTTTRWASLNKTGTQYIQFDFGALKIINKIKAMCGSAYAPEVFDIYSSNDGTSFSLVSSGKTISSADTLIEFSIPTTSCRYIKLIFTSTASASFFEMKEFEAWQETASLYSSSGTATYITTAFNDMVHGSSTINWNETVPSGTSLTISVNGEACTNGNEIPNLSGTLENLEILVTMTSDGTNTPILTQISITINDARHDAFVSTELIGAYKVICDISGRNHGVTVVNKITSRLAFSSGERVPVFSIHFYVNGITGYIDGGYYYEKANFSDGLESANETVIDINLWTADPLNLSESGSYSGPTFTANETVSILLT